MVGDGRCTVGIAKFASRVSEPPISKLPVCRQTPPYALRHLSFTRTNQSSDSTTGTDYSSPVNARYSCTVRTTRNANGGGMTVLYTLLTLRPEPVSYPVHVQCVK